MWFFFFLVVILGLSCLPKSSFCSVNLVLRFSISDFVALSSPLLFFNLAQFEGPSSFCVSWAALRACFRSLRGTGPVHLCTCTPVKNHGCCLWLFWKVEWTSPPPKGAGTRTVPHASGGSVPFVFGKWPEDVPVRCEAASSTPCPTDESFSLLLLSSTWSAVSPQRKVCSGRGFGVGQFLGPRACVLCHCPLESPQCPVTCGCSSHTGLCS